MDHWMKFEPNGKLTMISLKREYRQIRLVVTSKDDDQQPRQSAGMDQVGLRKSSKNAQVPGRMSANDATWGQDRPMQAVVVAQVRLCGSKCVGQIRLKRDLRRVRGKKGRIRLKRFQKTIFKQEKLGNRVMAPMIASYSYLCWPSAYFYSFDRSDFYRIKYIFCNKSGQIDK